MPEIAPLGDDTLALFTRLWMIMAGTKYISRGIRSFRSVRGVSRALNGVRGYVMRARGGGG